MIKAHIIKLKPTKSQDTFFRRSSGVARFAYNWALDKWKEDYENGIKKNSAYTLIKYLNSIKRTEFPWMQDTGKTCSQYAIHNLESAFKGLWKEGKGYPRFKKKGRMDSFVAVENKNSFKQNDFKIWIPRLGWVKCSENLRFEGKVNNVVIKRVANMWFAIINIEVSKSIPTLKQTTGENQAIVGVDFGISNMMVLSDGTIYENPRALKSNLKGLKRLQRSMSRKVKDSNNRKRAQIKLAKKHYRISCIRKTAIHQATAAIVMKYDRVVIENLNVVEMLKNHTISQAVGDASFSEIRRQLTYKCEWYGKELVVVDRFYPSSKTCSSCGAIKDIKLSERTYKCDKCGLKMGRDLNASINLANFGSTLKYKGSKASGEGSSIPEMEYIPSVKDEIINLSNQIVQKCTIY